MDNKLKSYDNATKKIILQSMSFDAPNHNRFSLPEIVHLLRESFKYKLTYRKIFGRNMPNDGANPSTDYCTIASQYICDKPGGSDVWTLVKTPIHWWLLYNATGEIFDITYDQFSKGFPYHLRPTTPQVEDMGFKKILIEKTQILGRVAGME
jgi:hypothetical protein